MYETIPFFMDIKSERNISLLKSLPGIGQTKAIIFSASLQNILIDA